MLFKLGIFVFGLVSGSDKCSKRRSEYDDYVSTRALDGEASVLVAKTAGVDALFTTPWASKCRDDVCEVYFSLKKKVLEEMMAAALATSTPPVSDVVSTVSDNPNGEATRGASVQVHNPNAPTLRSERSTVRDVAEEPVEPEEPGTKEVAKPVTPRKPIDTEASRLFSKIVHILLNDSKLINDRNKGSEYYCGNAMPELVETAGFVLGILVKCNDAKRKFESIRSQPSGELREGRLTQYEQFVEIIGSHFDGDTPHKISSCEVDLCRMSYLTAAGMARNPNSQNVDSARTMLVQLLTNIAECNMASEPFESAKSEVEYIKTHILGQ